MTLRPLLLVFGIGGPLAVFGAGAATAPASKTAAQATGFRIGRELLAIGSQLDAEEYIFGRVETVLRLAGGTFVVADASSHSLKFYDSSGKHVLSSGRKGQGPGEFQNLGLIGECSPDSVFAYDYTQHRMSVFSSNGRYIRAFKLQGPGNAGTPYQWRCARSGLLVVSGWPSLPNIAPGRHYHTSVPIGIARLDGRIVKTMGAFAGDERTRFERSDGPRAFGGRLIIAVGRDRVLIGPAGDSVLRAYPAAGDSTGFFHPRISPERIQSAELRIYRDSLLRLAQPQYRASWARQLSETVFPTSYPRYENALFDSDGRIWVQKYRKPGEAVSRSMVFSPTGARMHDLQMPFSFAPTQIDRDRVTGISTDSLGVTYIRVYALIAN